MKESIILYGPENSSKYKHAYDLLLPYSKSGLKYKRKIEITLNNEIYYYNISDVHFEIDFELLGTNENGLWNEFYSLVSNIVQTQTHLEFGVILCRNFQFIDQELLSIFYTFMRNPKIRFIFCTRYLSFLPSSLKEICKIIALKKVGNEVYGNQYKPYCDKIVEFIQFGDDLFLLREYIYQLFTYNYDIHLCLQYIYFEILKTKRMRLSVSALLPILEKYNTKYRSIYHLENFCMTLKLNLIESRPLE
jgi:hypothetical protein